MDHYGTLKMEFQIDKISSDAICYETEKGFKRKPYRKSIQSTLNLEFPKHEKFHDFLSNLLHWESSKRLTAVEAINHPWITET